jgi:hypothetical protein
VRTEIVIERNTSCNLAVSRWVNADLVAIEHIHLRGPNTCILQETVYVRCWAIYNILSL